MWLFSLISDSLVNYYWITFDIKWVGYEWWTWLNIKLFYRFLIYYILILFNNKNNDKLLKNNNNKLSLYN